MNVAYDVIVSGQVAVSVRVCPCVCVCVRARVLNQPVNDAKTLSSLSGHGSAKAAGKLRQI